MEYLKLIEDKEGFVHWDGATEQEIECRTGIRHIFPIAIQNFFISMRNV